MKKTVYVVVVDAKDHEFNRTDTTIIGATFDKDEAIKVGQNHVRKELANFLSQNPDSVPEWYAEGRGCFAPTDITPSEWDFDLCFKIEKVPCY